MAHQNKAQPEGPPHPGTKPRPQRRFKISLSLAEELDDIRSVVKCPRCLNSLKFKTVNPVPLACHKCRAIVLWEDIGEGSLRRGRTTQERKRDNNEKENEKITRTVKTKKRRVTKRKERAALRAKRKTRTISERRKRKKIRQKLCQGQRNKKLLANKEE